MNKLIAGGIVAALLLAGIGFGINAVYDAGYEKAEAEGKLTLETLQRSLTADVVRFQKQATAAEAKLKSETARISQEGSDNAQKIRLEAEKTIALLASDNSQLRKRFTPTAIVPSGSGVPKAGTPPGVDQNGSVEVIGLQVADVAFLVRYSADAELSHNALQACTAISAKNEALYDEWYKKEGTLSVQ